MNRNVYSEHSSLLACLSPVARDGGQGCGWMKLGQFARKHRGITAPVTDDLIVLISRG